MANDQGQSDIIDLARRTQALIEFNRTAAPQLERIVQVQKGITKELESFARNWFKRRHEATETAFKALQEANVAGKTDPAAAMQAITEWQRGSFERLNADLNDWAALCMRCADAAITIPSNMVSGDANLNGAGKTISKTESGVAGKPRSKADGKDMSNAKSTGHATPV